MREGVVEPVVAFDHLDADAAEKLRREGRCGAVAGGADHLQRAGHAKIAGQVVEISFTHAIDEFISATGCGGAFATEHDVAQFGHFVRAVGEGALEPHFHAGPAVGVVAGGDHGDGRHIEMELGEIGHGAERRADILDPDTGLHQAEDQGVFDRQRIVAVIVADSDHRLDAATLYLGAEAEPEGGDAGQVDGFGILPAGIVFAEAGGRDHRVAQEIPGVWGDVGEGFLHGTHTLSDQGNRRAVTTRGG